MPTRRHAMLSTLAADIPAAHRLRAIYKADGCARDGGLMSYGADSHESLTCAAWTIDCVHKGARPGDFPYETQTRYLSVVNLKTARPMGVQPPVTLLGLADDVIE